MLRALQTCVQTPTAHNICSTQSNDHLLTQTVKYIVTQGTHSNICVFTAPHFLFCSHCSRSFVGSCLHPLCSCFCFFFLCFFVSSFFLKGVSCTAVRLSRQVVTPQIAPILDLPHLIRKVFRVHTSVLLLRVASEGRSKAKTGGLHVILKLKTLPQVRPT